LAASAAPLGLSIRGLRSDLAGPFELEARSGEPIVVTGRSGSGKSLFLRMLADLDVNDGTVLLDGADRSALSAPQWRHRVTYVAAESGWWLDRVDEHLPRERLDEAATLAEALGLAREQLSADVAHLSSGERQRFALVRALLQEPRALLLDEPTGALDQGSTEKVEMLLKDLLTRGMILFLVTHDPALAERMGGRRFEMADRRLRPL
jgi:ABC-type iron transport system FetAB ATPase subunit